MTTKKPKSYVKEADNSFPQDILPQDIPVLMKTLLSTSLEKDRDIVESIIFSGLSLNQEKVLESIIAGSQAIYLRTMLRTLESPEATRKYSKKELMDSLRFLGYIVPKDT